MRKANPRCSGFSNESLIHPAAQPASGFVFRPSVVIPAPDFSLALRGGSQWRRDSATPTGSGVTLSAIPISPILTSRAIYFPHEVKPFPYKSGSLILEKAHGSASFAPGKR